MTTNRFLEHMRASAAPLLSDGAMGTMISSQGLEFDACFDALNLSQPGLIEDIHYSYLQAGAQIIQTNTFGANRFKLGAFGLSAQVAEINRAGVEIARHALAAQPQTARPLFVAGDVGPLGVRLAPYGRVKPAEAHAAFAEQIAALAEAGVDLILIETFSDLVEIAEAVAAAKAACDLPVFASMTFTRDDRTMLGDPPTKVARRLLETGADGLGVNCSGGPAQIWRILRQMRQAAPQALLSAMPNAGWPEQVGGRIMYPAHPNYFGEYALAFCEAGASLIGGCCGTTPRHIAAMRAALDSLPEGCGPSISELSMPGEEIESQESSRPPSHLAQNFSEGRFVIAVEMDPPRGLSAHKVIAGASLLAEAGADVINVADSPMARMRMSPWAVCELIQRQVGVDTTLHFPTRGRNLLRVQGDLLAAHALGIRNVFVVMGDPTAIGDYPDAMDDYDLAPSGLIKLIQQGFNAGLDHAGLDIGQPTSFFVGAALNLCPADPERELKVLRRKLASGVDFFLTQPVYEPQAAAQFLERYADQFGPLETPILVGMLPLFSVRHTAFLHHEVPGINIPPAIQERIRAAGDRAPEAGVQIALELVEQTRAWAKGVYLMPAFNRFDLAAEIVEGIRLKAPAPHPANASPGL